MQVILHTCTMYMVLYHPRTYMYNMHHTPYSLPLQRGARPKATMLW